MDRTNRKRKHDAQNVSDEGIAVTFRNEPFTKAEIKCITAKRGAQNVLKFLNNPHHIQKLEKLQILGQLLTKENVVSIAAHDNSFDTFTVLILRNAELNQLQGHFTGITAKDIVEIAENDSAENSLHFLLNNIAALKDYQYNTEKLNDEDILKILKCRCRYSMLEKIISGAPIKNGLTLLDAVQKIYKYGFSIKKHENEIFDTKPTSNAHYSLWGKQIELPKNSPSNNHVLNFLENSHNIKLLNTIVITNQPIQANDFSFLFEKSRLLHSSYILCFLRNYHKNLCALTINQAYFTKAHLARFLEQPGGVGTLTAILRNATQLSSFRFAGEALTIDDCLEIQKIHTTNSLCGARINLMEIFCNKLHQYQTQPKATCFQELHDYARSFKISPEAKKSRFNRLSDSHTDEDELLSDQDENFPATQHEPTASNSSSLDLIDSSNPVGPQGGQVEPDIFFSSYLQFPADLFEGMFSPYDPSEKDTATDDVPDFLQPMDDMEPPAQLTQPLLFSHHPPGEPSTHKNSPYSDTI